MTKPQIVQSALAEYEGVDDVEEETCIDCKRTFEWCDCFSPPVEFPLPYSTS